MDRLSTPQRKRPRNVWVVLAGVIVLGLAWPFAFGWAIRFFEAPWSISAFGPTLTGRWEGQLKARQGSVYQLYLDLDYEEPGRSSTNLRGRGRICNRHGETYDLLVRGSANRAGDRLILTLPKGADARPGPSLTLEGGWREQRLLVRPTSNPFHADGTYHAVRTVSTTDPDDSIGKAELRPGSPATFEDACRQLRP